MAVRGARDEKEKREDFFAPKNKHSLTHSHAHSTQEGTTQHNSQSVIENTLQYAQSGTCFHTGNLGRFGFLRFGNPKMTSSYPVDLRVFSSNHLLFSLSASRLFCWEKNQEQKSVKVFPIGGNFT